MKCERKTGRRAAQALRAEGAAAAARIGASVRDAFTAATQRIYWLTAILAAIGGALAMTIPELPLRTTHDRAVATDDPEFT